MKRSKMAIESMNLSFNIKQQLINLLSHEFETCGFNIVVGFESSFSGRIFTMQLSENNRLELCINLDAVKSGIDLNLSSKKIAIYYCALYIANYVKLMELSKHKTPETYFDGLVILNAIQNYKIHNTISVYSPLKGKKLLDSTYCIRPIEVESAIDSWNQILFLLESEISSNDKVVIKKAVNALLLYASLPEVSYISSTMPTYSLYNSLEYIEKLIALDSRVVTSFAIFELLSFQMLTTISTMELFQLYLRRENRFLIGIAIRMIAFMPLADVCGNNEECISDSLLQAINKYRENSVIYFKELSSSNTQLFKDNLFAIKKAVFALNQYMALHGLKGNSGTIHSIF